MNLPTRFLLPALLLAAGASSHANTTGFVTPSFRGQAGTEFGLWDNPSNFSVPYSVSLSAPGNTANPGGTSDAIIRQLGASDAFITGGGAAGNIYSFSSATRFVLSDANTSAVDTVIFQLRTAGTELDYSTLSLSYDLGAGIQHVTATRTELDRTAAGPGGFSVSSQYEFDLSGLGVHDYSIGFNASGSSMSLDSVSLDTRYATAVPEPETYAACFAGGLAGFALWRRRSVA